MQWRLGAPTAVNRWRIGAAAARRHGNGGVPPPSVRHRSDGAALHPRFARAAAVNRWRIDAAASCGQGDEVPDLL